MFAQILLKKHRDVVRGVFIHDIGAGTVSKMSDESESKIHMFETYAGAAVAATEAPSLLTDESLQVVLDACEEGLVEMSEKEKLHPYAGKLARDTEEGNVRLRKRARYHPRG